MGNNLKNWSDAERVANCRAIGLPDCPPAAEFMPEFSTARPEQAFLAADGYLWRVGKFEENGRDISMGAVITPEAAADGQMPDGHDESLRHAIWYRAAAYRQMDAAQREGVPLDGRVAAYLHEFEKPYWPRDEADTLTEMDLPGGMNAPIRG